VSTRAIRDEVRVAGSAPELGSQAEQAYQRLRELIVLLRLTPGAYVSESELSELVGLGRTPVREAVQRLSLEGFCDRLPRRGILIMPIDLDRQIDIQEVRLELEPMAARLAAERITDQEAEALRSLLPEPTVTSDPDNRVDEQLHLYVAAASKNEVLIGMLTPLYAHARRHWNQWKRRGLKEPVELLHGWKDIVDAICERDSAAAYQHMHAHVETTKWTLLNPQLR
jgi:DNA-binding GntR family transcriptional regulator